MRQFLRRVDALIRQDRLDRDLAEEIEFHRVMKQRELQHSGLDEEEAALAAQRALGNVTRAREDARAVWLWPWLEGLWQDASYLVRNLRRQPGFAAVVVITLGLGIGANTAIFSVIDTLLLRPPPIAHLEWLVSFQESNRQQIPFDVNPSPGNFLDWRGQTRSFDHLAACSPW